MIVVVLKQFGTQKMGDLVDASTWRNAERQLRARQIRAASASELKEYEKGVRNIHEKTETAKNKSKTAA